VLIPLESRRLLSLSVTSGGQGGDYDFVGPTASPGAGVTVNL
jgi:hypothetical protein